MRPSSRKRVGASLSQNSSNAPITHRFLRKYSSTNMPSTSTQNQFMMLNPEQDTSDSESMTTVTSKKNKRKKLTSSTANATVHTSSKPPPLNIVGVEYAKVSQLLSSIRKRADDFALSLAPFGIRVYSANTDMYNVLKSELQKAAIQFFTYQLREEQTTKIVLHGLFKMPEEELIAHLNEAGVHPIKVKQMKIHQKRYDDHCLYLLYFLKNEKIKISMLREIPAVCHVKVRWQYYTSKRTGPMQCSNCMIYGHGGNNCYLKPMCIRCGLSHKSSDCQLLVDPATNQPRERIPDDMLKCGLCGQNHSANFSRCPKRIEFMERQQRHRPQPPRRQQQSTSAFVHAPQLENFNFPSINPRARANQAEQNQSRRPIMSDDELFSPTELMSIFKELMAAISQARSKTEQISALGEIAIKYCHTRGR